MIVESWSPVVISNSDHLCGRFGIGREILSLLI